MFERFNFKNINPWQMIKLKYYHLFAKYALQNKHLLPNEVINNIKYNLNFIKFIYINKAHVIKILEDFYKI